MQVDSDGAGRPARVEIFDQSLVRPKTGEEGAFEMNEDGEIGDGRLGITSEENVKKILRQVANLWSFLPRKAKKKYESVPICRI